MKRQVMLTLASYLMSHAALGVAGSVQETNKQIVTQFYQKALNEKNFDEAQNYLGSWYIQHNPMAQDGLDGLKNYLTYLKNTYPQSHSEIKRIIADGDYVVVHVHSVLEPDTKGRAIIDIFRLENGKIYEHWDVIQPIPDEAANSNGMF
ncbi:nuclear transport factor 2 family protein [Legionella pneumophila]|uniref:nuclear transport factor 2 family protein n=1 Tax=Legionella pneumophila TaxID=446 RepID=UPI000491EED4|nr:ester cyclase [Legionella pneumophila]RYB33341.1 polyketide cyclase [Legionella pneumophila]RYW30156.1 polyketide cyclase [Legionella pneumophila]HAT1822245.1 polyketide cyclase [Legionella pneumophila]HAT1866683.1 polyketide cyclase [Legionella pneumophila]HAT1906810.1 polyketide cyclase [Legionella pneumophila]